MATHGHSTIRETTRQLASATDIYALDNTNTELLWVSCYTQFDNLAHKPRGKTSELAMISLQMNTKTGMLTPVGALEGILNPAFIRHHPTENVLYAVTESIYEDGDVVAFHVMPGGKLNFAGTQSCHGKSTCYLSITKELNRMLFVNYWDSSLGQFQLELDGTVCPAVQVLPPANVRARGLQDHLDNRQLEPHAHAIVPDPYDDRVIFVPDLGMDVVRQYVRDPNSDTLRTAEFLPCAPPELGPHGPRYIEFDPKVNVAYVVNELSSTVSVFRVDREAVASLASAGDGVVAMPKVAALELIQLISTRTSPAPEKRNTCGRIAIHPTGNFVLVSNRGDDSITIFRVDRSSGLASLSLVGIESTRGETPRHFQFAANGRFVIAANQDTNSLTVFRFEASTGQLVFTGNTYSCDSPNFVCVQPSHLASGIPASVSAEF